jgi:hypothetical protein
MSTDSTSPILHSSSSLSADDHHFSSPSDEIILRGYYPTRSSGYEDEEGTSLWHDLDRDGVNTPAIPSFILNSPPMGSMTLEMHRAHPEVTIHSLRKGTTQPPFYVVLIIGCDPKFFFGETLHEETLNAVAVNRIPDVDIISSDPSGQYSTRGYHIDTSSPTTSIPHNDSPVWSNDDISAHKYSPAQGPWGIIPSRSIMISNLPKTTQLWTLVELLKVPSSESWD